MDTSSPLDRGSDELFIDYVPAFHHMDDWERAFHHQYRAAPAASVRCVIWNQRANQNCRLLVEVAVCRSRNSARSRLEAVTRNDNVQFAEAPQRFGQGALIHPEAQPRGLYLARANLMIRILSFGRDVFDIWGCADRIVEELQATAPSETTEDLALAREPDSPAAPGAICLKFASQWDRGESGWLKFTARGGTLTRATDGDRLWLWPTPGEQEISVRGWVIEAGRKTYGGLYTGTPSRSTPTAE